MASQSASHDPDLELRVQRGPQAGARSPLPPMDDTRGWELHIGGAPVEPSEQRRGGRRRHDLALFGATPARLRATPAGDGHHIKLELLEGFASIDGRPLPAATPVPWPMYSNLQVADVALAFGSAVDPMWDDGGQGEAAAGYDAGSGALSRNGDAAPSSKLHRANDPSTSSGRTGFGAEGQTGFGAEGRTGFGAEGQTGFGAEGQTGFGAEGRTGFGGAAAPAATSATAGTNAAAASAPESVDPAAATAAASHPAPHWPRRLVIAGASLLAVSLLLFGLLKVTGWGGKPHNLVLVEQALASKGFTQLKLQLNAAGAPVISGTLPSAADRRALEELLARLGATAKLDIQLPSLSDQVAQYFTRIGVPGVQIENLGGGRIHARTRSAALATATQIDEAVADARRDIAGLEQLTIQNEVPKVAAAESACGKAANDPGKRPSSVVYDGKNSTLNTADGTRYRLGSTLPSGHVLKSIDKDKTVTVECDGRFDNFRL